VLLVAVIVFSCTDISPSAVEVNVQGLGNRLAADESGDSGKIWAGNAGAIIALRMTGIIAEHRDRPTLIPERQQRHLGIDDSFRLGSKGGVFRGGEANRANLTVWPEYAAVGRNLFHRGDAPAVVRGRLCRRDCNFDRLGSSLNHVPMESTIEPTIILQPKIANEPFGREIAAGRVVLMQGMDR